MRDNILAYEKPFYGQLYKIELMPVKEPENKHFYPLAGS